MKNSIGVGRDEILDISKWRNKTEFSIVMKLKSWRLRFKEEKSPWPAGTTFDLIP